MGSEGFRESSMTSASSPSPGRSYRVGRRQLLSVTIVLCGFGATGILAACGPAPAASPAAPSPAPKTPAPAAAAKPTTQAPAKTQPLTKIRFGFLPPILWQVPYYIGEEKGIFKNYGIDFQSTHFNDEPTILKGLLAGELDAADFNPASKLVAISKGAPIKIMGAIAPAMFLAVGVKKEIKSLRDLYGKTVGITGPGDLFTRTWRQLLKKEGLDYNQVQMATIGTSAASVQALIAGKIDGALFVIEFIPTVNADPNTQVLFIVAERLPDMALSSLSVRDQLIQEKPEVVQNFLMGTIASVRYVLDHKQEAVESVATRAKQKPEVASAGYDLYVKAKIWSENGVMSPETIKFSQEVNKEMGDQDTVLPLEKVANLEFQKKAVAQLGPYKRQN